MSNTEEMAENSVMPETGGEMASAPVARTDRIGSLDFIRGIAVLGILAANIIAFGQPWSAYMWPEAFLTEHGPGSDLMWVAQFILIDGKMRGLFTLLFGAGLALFMERAWARGQTRWLQMRRLAWLLAFGLFHFYFIWRGDILFLYASLGFVAVLCLRWAAKTQLMVGIISYILGAFIFAAMMGFPYFIAETSVGDQPEFAEAREQIDLAMSEAVKETQTEQAIMTGGSYADIIAHTFSAHAFDPLVSIFMLSFETLPLMLIGMAIYRMGFFSGGLNAGSMRRWGWAGVILGSLATAGIAIFTYQEGLTYWGTLSAMMAWMHLPRLPVVIGLAALFTLYGATASGWLPERLSAAGRMAFTNYLGTSVLMMLIFHPWAGGLWGELTRTQLYLVVLLTWALMLLWSKPWLERYRYGPLEWLWRSLTYWRRFPLKR
ncbi:DUF418 domain-containing protein [Erythrobacter sp. HA6-11]